MLISCAQVSRVVDSPEMDIPEAPKVSRRDVSLSNAEMAAVKLMHPDALGALHQGLDKHFYSSGAFNLIQLIFYVLSQTGPAHLFLTTYSISMDSISAIHRRVVSGDLLSVRFLIDNRVRSISPKPFDCLVTTFPDSYRCLALHAKVALVYNDDWHISIVGSQNATHNPKLERGIIHTNREIFDYDFKMLNDEYELAHT